MRLNDTLCDRQTQAGSRGFGCVKRIENLSFGIRRDARPIVLHVNDALTVYGLETNSNFDG